MPAGQFVHPVRHGIQVVNVLRSAPLEIEAHRPDSGPIQIQYFLIGNGCRELGDTNKLRSQGV